MGGCDEEGKPVFNDLTKMFLKATKEYKLLFPKIKCRYSQNSPAEYLDLINEDILGGRTVLLYQNDDAYIPSLLRMGISLKDARNYCLLGCWEPVIPEATNEHCGYVNLLKILELSVYGDWEHEEIKLQSIKNGIDFEEVYRIVLKNMDTVLSHKCQAAYQGRGIWKEVDPMLLVSSSYESCMQKKRDYTAGGMKYQIDELVCAGVVNVVDSLLVIKELCFDKKEYTLKELVDGVKQNWLGCEDMRRKALACSFWGDEKEESWSMLSRICQDIYEIADRQPALYDGRVTVGFMLYLEMQSWAKELRATPDGRRTGDYFERGLAPSRLHSVASITSVINCLRHIDSSQIAANSVLNMTLPMRKEHLTVLRDFMRVAAGSGLQALQLNCVSKEELLEARKNPEKFRDLVVRVCGYSAKFVSLSDEIQEEFLTRNFFGTAEL